MGDSSFVRSIVIIGSAESRRLGNRVNALESLEACWIDAVSPSLDSELLEIDAVFELGGARVAETK